MGDKGNRRRPGRNFYKFRNETFAGFGPISVKKSLAAVEVVVRIVTVVWAARAEKREYLSQKETWGRG